MEDFLLCVRLNNIFSIHFLYPFIHQWVHRLFSIILQWTCAGSQREKLCPWHRSWGRRLRHTQRWDWASGNPLFLSIYPQNQSAYFTVLCSHLHLWLYGRLSPITISLGEGVNLQLQLIKIPGHDKSVSTYKLLWRFSSLPEQVRPATCDCLQPPNRERHEMIVNFLNTDSFEKLENYQYSIACWLEIILVKGFSFVEPIFAAKSPYSLPL